jgi:hypothetical protein
MRHYNDEILANKIIAYVQFFIGIFAVASFTWLCYIFMAYDVTVWGTDYNRNVERFSIDGIEFNRNY